MDSIRVKSSHALRRLSEEGASGQALDNACVRMRLWMYGTRIVRTPCSARADLGSPDPTKSIQGLSSRERGDLTTVQACTMFRGHVFESLELRAIASTMIPDRELVEYEVD